MGPRRQLRRGPRSAGDRRHPEGGTSTDALTPDAPTQTALRSVAPDGPITLLNLLKFREDGGQDRDTVICVRSPGADHFLGLVEHPDYHTRAVPLRPEALERTLWMPVFTGA